MKRIYKYGIIGLCIVAIVLIVASGQGTILNMKAIEHSEFNRTMINDMEIRTGILVNYVIKVEGDSTTTLSADSCSYNGQYTVCQARGETYANYNLTQPVASINDAKVNAIRQYALDRWGFAMAKANVYYQAYQRGQ